MVTPRSRRRRILGSMKGLVAGVKIKYRMKTTPRNCQEERMSREALTTIVSRAITDSDYRVQLLNNPDAALQGYDLSEQEEKMIRSLSSDTFDAMALDLEARQSKSGFLGSISLMGGKDSVDMDSILNLMMNKYGGES